MVEFEYDGVRSIRSSPDHSVTVPRDIIGPDGFEPGDKVVIMADTVLRQMAICHPEDKREVGHDLGWMSPVVFGEAKVSSLRNNPDYEYGGTIYYVIPQEIYDAGVVEDENGLDVVYSESPPVVVYTPVEIVQARDIIQSSQAGWKGKSQVQIRNILMSEFEFSERVAEAAVISEYGAEGVKAEA